MGSVSVTFAFTRLAALALALGLAGCGVKGPLEPPPQSGIHPNAVSAQAATVPATPGALPPQHAATQPSGIAAQPASSAEAVANAPAAQRRSVLDWLVD
jgi:predicted small lipoprotein YifL